MPRLSSRKIASTAQVASTVAVVLTTALHATNPLPIAPAGTLESRATAQLHQHLDTIVNDNTVVGIAVVVTRNGAIAFEHYGGLLDLERKTPMADDSLVRIYSMSKSMTAIAALILIDEERMSLDDRVADWFPSWADQQVYVEDDNMPGGYRTEPVREAITIEHLLTHTAGIPYGYYGDSPTDRAYREAGLIDDWDYLAPDTERLVEVMGPIPLLHQPGERWHYGFASDVLGQVIERVSGQSLDRFLEARVFAPLGIEAYFDVPQSQFARFGTNHIHAPDGSVTVQDTPYREPEFVDVSFISGGGGVVTTARGFTRFALMLENGGELDGRRVASEAAVRRMTTNRLPARMGLRWGYGVAIAGEEGPLQEGAYGFGGAAGTAFWVDPTERMVAVIMVQRIGLPANVVPDIQTLTYQLLPDEVR